MVTLSVSGGVLLNNSGEVIGITSGSFTAGQNLNMAVAVSEIEKLYAKAPIELSVAKYYEENTIPTIVPGTLVIGTSADFEPLEYYDHAGNIIGIEPEIMKAILTFHRPQDIAVEVQYLFVWGIEA